MATPPYSYAPYPPAPYAYYGAPPYGMPGYPPEAQSLNELLTAAKIIAIILAIFEIIGFLVGIVIWLVGFGFDWFAAFVLVGAVVNIAFFAEAGALQDLVASGQYPAAKEKALVWVILEFVFGWVIVGVLVLVAYLKFEGLLSRPRGWTAAAWPGPQPPSGASVHPSYAPAPARPAPAPLPPASAPGATPMVLCPHCGRPPAWVPGFNRWYCYLDGLYL
ncbi:MAG TPA: hypothetical protein VGS23_00915 [Thermoplasmata archaeon]|nr:hypothetical protein [Thermoplasmata archaeon]